MYGIVCKDKIVEKDGLTLNVIKVKSRMFYNNLGLPILKPLLVLNKITFLGYLYLGSITELNLCTSIILDRNLYVSREFPLQILVFLYLGQYNDSVF